MWDLIVSVLVHYLSFYFFSKDIPVLHFRPKLSKVKFSLLRFQ